MAKKRRTVNVQADLIDAAARAYEENQSAALKAVNPTPSVAQLTESGLRIMIDFLEGRLFYTEDLDSRLARPVRQRLSELSEKAERRQRPGGQATARRQRG